MIEFSYTIKDKLGIHARPAGLLVKTADKFSSDITISKNDKSGDAKRIFSVMALGIKYDDEVKLTISGNDEEKAKEALEQFFKENL